MTPILKGAIAAILLSTTTLLVACDAQPTAGPIASAPTIDATPKPRFDPAKIEQMKAQLLAEPKIKDLLYDERAAVPWQIGVFDNGTLRHGYAGYVCLQLQQAGLADDRTNVRIVDIGKLNASEGDFRGASLGHVYCATGRETMP